MFQLRDWFRVFLHEPMVIVVDRVFRSSADLAAGRQIRRSDVVDEIVAIECMFKEDGFELDALSLKRRNRFVAPFRDGACPVADGSAVTIRATVSCASCQTPINPNL
jgi:hypothetical protein